MTIPRNLGDLANQVNSSGTLGIAGGGTGLTTIGSNGQVLSSDGTNAVWATMDALPSQTGNADKYLYTNGTTASWQLVTSGAQGFVTQTNMNTTLLNANTGIGYGLI